jgi:hypothetical protein
MTKMTKIQSDGGEHGKRLQEIAETQFGILSDDEVLRLLAERKRLSDLEREYRKVQEEEAARLEQERKEKELQMIEKKKAAILKKIADLNKSISPEKPDEDLLTLVAQRKELEKELEELGTEAVPQAEESLTETTSDESQVPEIQAVVPKEERVAQTEIEPKKSKVPFEGDFGNEKIVSVGIEEGSEFYRYLDQLKNNVGSLGELLQKMPLAAKKNKAFMLKVAEIDPAYAMHYADKETLKRDEDFNLRIASLGNPRNSGNALAEMLPEARTSKVLLAAVKQDYRNVRFIQPNMADYDEMIHIAEKRALEKIKNLKDATDVMLLIPKPLQQNKQFMLQVKEIAEPK